MALDASTLTALCEQGFGPFALAAHDGAWDATFAGRPATVALDGPAVAVGVTRPVRWPSGGASPGDLEFRVAVALRALELDRRELCHLEPVAARDAVQATVWLDAAGSGPIDLARAVQVALALGDLAARAVDQVRAAAAAEDEVRTTAELTRRAADQARAALAHATDAADALDAPTPATTPTPTTATATPTATAGAPDPAPADGAKAGVAPFVATHRVPTDGLAAWEQPDPGRTPVATLDPGLTVRVLEQRPEGWARIVCENEWAAWVDGRRLVALP